MDTRRVDMASEDTGKGRSEGLALLYQGLYTTIVRIQAGKQAIQDAASFRARIKSALLEIEREAARVGLSPEETTEASYAVVAFLDETIQRSVDPARLQWSPLQAELFGKAVAGEGFYDRLELLMRRRSSPNTLQLLEVYLLSLLLGYQGKYGIEGRGELRGIIEDLRIRLRGHQNTQLQLSPSVYPPEDSAPPAPVPVSNSRGANLMILAALLLIVVSWAVFKAALSFQSSGLNETLSVVRTLR